MQAHMWGSTMVADGKVYCGDEDGDMLVFASAKEKKILSEVNMGASILSTPVVANGTIFIATQTHLFAIGDTGKPVTAAPAAVPVKAPVKAAKK
jgi:outer membrane protein assembly factor BamB